jgi:hypothetical protein
MSFQEAFAAHEGLQRAFVMADTWGYPKPQIKYPVDMIICHTTYGAVEVFKYISELDDDLGNPFFHEDLGDFLGDIKTEEENLYRWTGYYLKYKNGGYRFTGKLVSTRIVP